MKSKLSVFTPAPYGKWQIHKKIIWFFRSLKCAWQRATKGYCYRDTWDLNHFYTQLFIDSITSFKHILHGAPSDLYDEKNDSIEKWENYLDEMVLHFYNSLEENEVQKNEFAEEHARLCPFVMGRTKDGELTYIRNTSPEAVEIDKKYWEREVEIAEWREAQLNKGLDMLKERFYDLWD